MTSIRHLEKPKGCIKVFAYLKESQPACISDIQKSTGLSQGAVYSSLSRMKRLGVVGFREEGTQGKPNMCSLTDWGARLGCFVFAYIDTLREISGKYDVGPYVDMPVGSLSVLVHIYHEGSTYPTQVHSELGICWGSVLRALKRLTHLGLISFEKKKAFRRTIKEYKLTKRGERIALYLDTINMALGWKGM